MSRNNMFKTSWYHRFFSWLSSIVVGYLAAVGIVISAILAFIVLICPVILPVLVVAAAIKILFF
jgi:hypothetical protein